MADRNPNHPDAAAEGRNITTLLLEDVIDPNATFEPAALAAARALARSKPWRGTFEDRMPHFAAAGAALLAAYELTGWTLTHEGPRTGCSGESDADPDKKAITLRGHLSVVTLLHLVARARGMDGYRAIRWSVNLFKRCYPISFARCTLVNGLLVNITRRDD